MNDTTVTIDYEDREQVERIVAILHDGDPWFGGGPNQPTHTSLLQKALREFADPKPPKPVEPLGLGAVIEDDEGDYWVRLETGTWAYQSNAGGGVKWRELHVVRVLSEGVTP